MPSSWDGVWLRHGHDATPGGGQRAEYLFTGRHRGFSQGVKSSLNLAEHVGDDPDHVEANRAALAHLYGCSRESLVFIRADHGSSVRVRTSVRDDVVANDGKVLGPGARGDDRPDCPYDAVVSARPEDVLVTLAADCAPVVLADVDAGIIGVAHCGWKGLVVDVVGATVRACINLGAVASRMRACVGPTICGGCYRVNAERVELTTAQVPTAATADGAGIDIRRTLIGQLRTHGIDATAAGPCTYENPAQLFSHRYHCEHNDQWPTSGVHTGRQAGVIGWKGMGG